MKRSRFTEEQIFGVLRKQEVGMEMAGTQKRCSTEQGNTVVMGVTATQDSTFDWRKVGAQVSGR
jgi:hypothetical protein